MIEVPVRFGDCDPFGIVFYPNFQRWFDAACWELFRRAGIPASRALGEWGVSWPLVTSDIRYVSAARQDDVIAIASHVARWGTSSFDVRHSATIGARLVAESLERRVWAARPLPGADKVTPLPIPDEVKAALPAVARP